MHAIFHGKKGEIFIKSYGENRVEFFSQDADTTTTTDSITGQMRMTISKKDPYPVTLNGRPIALSTTDTAAVVPYAIKTANAGTLKKLNTALRPELEMLASGDYYAPMITIIIDEQGRIAFMDMPGFALTNYDAGQKGITEAEKQRLDAIILETLGSAGPYPVFRADNQPPSPYELDIFPGSYRVKKGKVIVR